MSDDSAATRTAAGLAARLDRLEAEEAVKALKHRYLRACDAKAAATFRACFIRQGASIDYGALGAFDDADAIAAVFERIALHKVDGKHVVLDMHHGIHPSITIHSPTTASGQWTLAFRQVNLTQGTETVMSGEYADEYVVEDGEWKMSRCHFTRLWSITRSLDDAVVEQ